MGVTTVVRGEDHVSNTALQLQMFGALGAEPPKFAHEALLTGTEGKLSKRLGSLDCDALREEGIEPLALAALLAHLGTSDPVEPATSLKPLIDGIDFSRFGRAPARFDMTELQSLNAKTVHAVPFADVAARLPVDEESWLAIRPNLSRISDAHEWLAVITGPIEATIAAEDTEYLAEAAKVAQNLDWGSDPWHALTGALKEATGRKGKPLFMPLRQALTGRDHGPDMAALLPLIGKGEALKRLQAG
jgi:glutamyl-tRNA synthetase